MSLPHVYELEGAAPRRDVDHDGFPFAEVAVDEFERQRILNQTLDGAPHRPGAVLRVVPLLNQELFGAAAQFNADVSLTQSPGQLVDLDLDDA